MQVSFDPVLVAQLEEAEQQAQREQQEAERDEEDEAAARRERRASQARPKGETPEEKKARKAAVKDAKVRGREGGLIIMECPTWPAPPPGKLLRTWLTDSAPRRARTPTHATPTTPTRTPTSTLALTTSHKPAMPPAAHCARDQEGPAVDVHRGRCARVTRGRICAGAGGVQAAVTIAQAGRRAGSARGVRASHDDDPRRRLEGGRQNCYPVVASPGSDPLNPKP